MSVFHGSMHHKSQWQFLVPLVGCSLAWLVLASCIQLVHDLDYGKMPIAGGFDLADHTFYSPGRPPFDIHSVVTSHSRVKIRSALLAKLCPSTGSSIKLVLSDQAVELNILRYLIAAYCYGQGKAYPGNDGGSHAHWGSLRGEL